MSNPLPLEENPVETLQFDNAEFTTVDPGRLTCAACKCEVDRTYYEFQGQTICNGCRILIEGHRNGGSRVLRLARSVLFGSLAALAGFAIYLGVLKGLGMHLSLISILVGFMVGSAVRAGSRHRGGWAYQLLAVFLTYTAIALSFGIEAIPLWLAEVEKNENLQGGQAANVPPPAVGDPAKALAARPDPNPAPAEAAVAPKALKPAKNPIAKDMNTSPSKFLLTLLVLIVAVLALSYALPVLMAQEAPMVLIIVGFALWEAWKLNRRVPLVFNGPFTLEGGAAPPPTEIPSHA